MDAKLTPSPSLSELQASMNTMAGNSDKLVSTLRALQQQSNNVGTDIGNSLGSQLMSRTNTALAAGGGGLLGAGLGGAAGYLAGKDDSKQKDSSGLTTLIGALGGGGAGLLGGGMMADTMFKNAFEKGWVKAATTVGLNEKQAFALLPSWGGQKWVTKRKAGLRGEAGYSYLMGAVPFPHLGVEAGTDKATVGISGPLPGISLGTGIPKDYSGRVINHPQSFWKMWKDHRESKKEKQDTE